MVPIEGWQQYETSSLNGDNLRRDVQPTTASSVAGGDARWPPLARGGEDCMVVRQLHRTRHPVSGFRGHACQRNPLRIAGKCASASVTLPAGNQFT
jgi:hypothetical protein